MKPESHLRLARYHYNLGNRVQAFYIAEYARQMFGDDDPTVQTHALHTLLDHSGDIADLNVIRSMLKSDDLVKRAMAAFLVVKCLGPAEFPLLGENLTSGIELVQIDTMEALGMTGGPKGLEYLKAHPPAKATGEIMGFWRHQISPRHNPGEKDGPENGGQSPGSPE
jgi:hypothetical protein